MSTQAFLIHVLILSLVPYPAGAAELPAQVGDLKVFVLEGDRAINNVRTRQATAPVVEVRDSDNRPVEGAEVLIELPAAGPGAFFTGKVKTARARTNHQGQAAVSGYEANSEIGRFEIRVTAKAGSLTGRAIITQLNSTDRFGREDLPRASGGKKKWWLLGIVAAAGAGAAVGLTRSGSGSTDVVLSPGGVSVGAPR